MMRQRFCCFWKVRALLTKLLFDLDLSASNAFTDVLDRFLKLNVCSIPSFKKGLGVKPQAV